MWIPRPTATAVSVGLSALFYLAKWDMTRAYLVPRYVYSSTSTSIDGPFAGLSTDTRINGHELSVSFGAQHALGERFAVYGELGLEVEKSTFELTTTEQDRTAFGTRSGVGDRSLYASERVSLLSDAIARQVFPVAAQRSVAPTGSATADRRSRRRSPDPDES